MISQLKNFLFGRLSGSATEYYDGTGNFSTPAGGGSGTVTIVPIGITIDGSGSPITPQVFNGIVRRVTQTGTIVSWSLFTDIAANLEFDVFLDAPGTTYPPTTSIVASAPPELTGVDFDDDTGLSGWTTAVTVGDVFGFELVANDNATRITLQLNILVA